jgi:DNA-binding transcriptional LysR family regulator
MHDLDTALLRTFAALAETRSFSRTGERVGRSQSAVSGQIRKLEETLGRVLIERTTRSVRLTPDGDRLLAFARRMIGTADAMIEHFRSEDVRGEVRFGAPEDFASAYLPDILGVFAAAHEHVTLHVSCELTLRLIEDFEAGRRDVVIVKQDPAAPLPGARVLWREDLVWAAAPDWAMPFETAGARFAALGRPLPLVLSPSPCVYRSRAAAALDARRIPWTAVYSTQSLTGAVAAVKAGLGWAVMPEAMLPKELVAVGRSLGWPDLPPAEIALLAVERPSPAAAALARYVLDRAATLRAAADVARRKPAET